ncbi:MAG: tetratricopeptide repeat protein [Chloroflexota bacterium]
MNFLKNLFGKSKTEQAAYGFVSETPGKGLSPEEASALQEQLQSVLTSTNDVHTKINYAARLMTSQQYELCIQAYEKIAEDHPEERATCESQIGVAHFFLGDYEKAIQFYKQALEHGEDADMMADNIAEAEEALAKKR